MTLHEKILNERKVEKKVKKDLFNRFELIYSKVHHKLDASFKKSNTTAAIQECWNKIPAERMVGMLHAFILLGPSINKAFAM